MLTGMSPTTPRQYRKKRASDGEQPVNDRDAVAWTRVEERGGKETRLHDDARRGDGPAERRARG